MRIASLTVIAAGVLVLGCSVDPRSLYGTYVVRFPAGSSTLTLNQDGTFEQFVKRSNGTSDHATGTWFYDRKDASIFLKGDAFDVKDHRIGGVRIDVIEMPVHRFRAVTIECDVTQSCTYEKQR